MAEEMGTAPAGPEEDAPAPTGKIDAIHFEGWAPLGGPVTLSLSPRRTVLVGRNGGGKSLLLEGLFNAFGGLFYDFFRRTGPPSATLDFRIDDQPLHYSYRFELSKRASSIFRQQQGEIETTWTDTCWTASPDAPLFRAERGTVKFHSGEEFKVSPAQSSLGLIDTMSDAHPRLYAQMKPILELARRLDFVSTVLFGHRIERRDIFFTEDGNPELLHAGGEYTAKQLFVLWRDARDDFAELAELGKRVGLLQELRVETYEPGRKKLGQAHYAVLVDGVNLGHASDGTLRVLDILRGLIRSSEPPATILIDEPELGIHPGLLARLLHEIDAYCIDSQVVVATQSPQVVSWARPDELRLVERKDGRTAVRTLDESLAARVYSYLQEQGGLGDFVYGGGLDD